MWLIEMISYLVGPTVAGFINAVIAGILGIFILLWNISPIALVAFLIVLYVLSKLSAILSSIVFWICAASAAFYYDHPVVACLIGVYVLKKLFVKEKQTLSNEEIEDAREKGSQDARELAELLFDDISRPESKPEESVKLTSPVNGTILTVNVKPGTMVSTGETLMSIDTDEGVINIVAPKDGIVFNVFVIVGRNIKKGELLLQV